jgi:hypothetical protein
MSTKKQFIQEQLNVIEERSTKRQIEAAKLFFAAKQGDMLAKVKIAEGISTSDIPTLLEPTINVTFLAQYAEQPTVWDQIADTYEAPDFGALEFGDFQIDGSSLISNDGDEFVNGGLPVVGEYDEYPAVKFVVERLEKDFDRKRGARMRISWEALRKSGNVDIIGRATEAFARMAAHQEDISLAKQFLEVGTGAANADNWAGREITGNPDISADGIGALSAALEESRATLDPSGNPIVASSYKLVYGSALDMPIRKVLGINNIQVTDANGVYETNPQLVTGLFRPIMFPTLDKVGGSGASKTWFILPEAMPRPQLWQVFLQGNRAPLITVKDSGHFSLGGGEVPVREGSFTEDDIQTRVRHIVDSVAVDLTASLYSDGSGS